MLDFIVLGNEVMTPILLIVHYCRPHNISLDFSELYSSEIQSKIFTEVEIL